MYAIKTTILTSAFLLGSSLFAQEANGEGKELFHDAKCLSCHNTTDFKVNEKKVANFKKLQRSVNACATNTNAAWFDDETEEVVHYLNNKYYKFKAPKKMED